MELPKFHVQQVANGYIVDLDSSAPGMYKDAAKFFVCNSPLEVAELIQKKSRKLED